MAKGCAKGVGMAILHVLTLLAPVFTVGGPALRPTKLGAIGTDFGSYSFTKFVHDFDRPFVAGTREYQQRASLFQESLERILAVNAQNAKEGRSWTSGIHPFMDWTAQERKSLHGYKPSRNQRRARTAMTGLQRGTVGLHSRLNASYDDQDSYTGFGAQPRVQGNCGSCWAISAAEAVEVQLKRSGHNERVSAQALVDCVPNPQHCGGTGGCDGATSELAYQFMQEHGIPLESELPYRKSSSFGPQQDPAVCKMMSTEANYPAKRRVIVDGWESKPSNHVDSLKQALMEEGAVVVAVDANDWFDYSTGVFDGCSKDAELGHAVLAKGFGKDDKEGGSGKKYWLIQNSWSTGWGENGDIRILRHDKDDDWCGTDHAPQKGEGCDGGPETVPVCGMCGVLYDPLVPKGVHIADDNAVGSFARASAGDYTAWRPS